MYTKFFISLLKHKYYVFLAGVKVGVPIWRLIVHDWQKFTKWEFKQYAQNFHFEGEKPERAGIDFAYAWLHHENTAPHHWGYWIPRSGKYADQPLEMPLVYVKEMIADWMGASKAYTGSWDMTEWLDKNLPRIEEKMHKLTIEKVRKELKHL